MRFRWAAALVCFAPGVARADEAHAAAHGSALDRPHTVAEIEGGIIALPTAPISPAYRGGQTPLLGPIGNGDATIQTGVHLLFRASPKWAFGAGAVFAPNPTTDPNYYAGASHLPRSHSRNYLFLGGEGRYFPLRVGSLEGWVGVTGGAIIVADRFSTNTGPSVPSILGNRTVTVSSEGFAIGLQAGADYAVTDQLTIGLALRADQWFLPGEKPFSQESSCDALGDCPTLTGRVTALELGVTAGYHIPL